jgi:hypothetical protein
MKTILVTMQLCILVTLSVMLNRANAQTIISFDNSPDNTMVMKIQDPKLTEKPDKIILIFDSTTLTCEFSKDGVIALHATENKKGDSHKTVSYSCVFSNKSTTTEQVLKDIPITELKNDDVEKEEPLHLEDWMLHPDEWNKNTKL